MRPFSRRELLAGAGIGALGLGASGVFGIRARGEPPPVRLVLVVANGGWDPSFTVDPKPHRRAGGPYPDLDPDRPDDVEQLVEYGEIVVSSNPRRRPAVDRFFETWLERTAVVNGLWTGSLSHWDAMVRLLTGTADQGAPDVAVLAGAVSGDERLAAVDLSGLSRFGDLAPWCARIGMRDQLAELLADGNWRPTGADRRAIRGYLDARAAAEPEWARTWADRAVALDRLAVLRERAELLSGTLPPDERKRFVENVPLVVSLLGQDLCRAVVVSTGSAWDTHARGSRQHDCWDQTLAGLGNLCERLDEVGLLDRTLIAVVSELGRSPERNALGGTDHWTFTSAMLVGAGVAGGRLVGGTDDDSVGIGTDPRTGRPSAAAGPLSTVSLAAGVLEAVGVDPAPLLPGVVPLRAFRA